MTFVLPSEPRSTAPARRAAAFARRRARARRRPGAIGRRSARAELPLASAAVRDQEHEPATLCAFLEPRAAGDLPPLLSGWRQLAFSEVVFRDRAAAQGDEHRLDGFRASSPPRSSGSWVAAGPAGRADAARPITAATTWSGAAEWRECRRNPRRWWSSRAPTRPTWTARWQAPSDPRGMRVWRIEFTRDPEQIELACVRGGCTASSASCGPGDGADHRDVWLPPRGSQAPATCQALLASTLPAASRPPSAATSTSCCPDFAKGGPRAYEAS